MNVAKKLIVLLFLVLVMIMGGCKKAGTSTPTSLPTSTIGTPAPYPAPSTEVVPGSDVVYVVPTPGTDTGVVIGVILDETDKQPIGGATIYLATRIWMTPAPSYSYAIQENSSPHTMADEQGRFAIGNVTPGVYDVMVWTPFRASVIIDSSTEKELAARVEAGKILDLGTIEGIDPMKTP